MSHRVLKSFVVAAMTAAAAVVAVPAQSAPARAPVLIPNQYIVVLDAAALPKSLARLPLAQQIDGLLVQVGGGAVLARFSSALKGFSVRLTANQAAALAKLPGVKSIEQDQVMQASVTQTGATWGIDRVDQRNMPLDGRYIYRLPAGQGVTVYVLDTGLNASHTDFTGRVATGRNFAPNSDGIIGGLIPGGLIPLNLGALDFGTGLLSGDTDPSDTTDCNGHGTHVAGSAVGTVYGVAKQAKVAAVRVLGCNGSGSNTGVIAGVDWVTANAVKPAVANMSLGGGESPALDTAVENAVASGVAMVVAAGNSSADACSGSPNGVPAAITVGSTDRGDGMSSFSNFGPCIDLFAPGGSITSADSNSNTGATVLSGTSMASPHVAGAAALILGENRAATPADIVGTLITNATSGKITSLGAGSPNLLLYTAP